MTHHVDLYYTIRSPYCYLATPQLVDLTRSYDLKFNVKPVYPLAVSDPTFFQRVNPLWPPYLMKDTTRIARRLGIPYRWPRPDPIVQDPATGRVAAEQPYIRRLTGLAQLAAEDDKGLEFVAAASALLFIPEINGWNIGDHLANAVENAELHLQDLESRLEIDAERVHTAILQNREDQLAAGHWGAPLFVYDGEVFFGQDRITDLVWHLQQHGLEAAK